MCPVELVCPSYSVVIMATDVCAILLIGISIWLMHCPLLMVACLFM